MPRAPLALALLLCAALASAEDPFRRALELAAAARPQAVYQDPRPLPPAFAAWLEERHVRRAEDLRVLDERGAALGNAELLALLDRFEGTRALPAAPARPEAREPLRLRLPFVEALDDAQRDARGLFDSSRPPQDGRERRGLRLHGFELGGGADLESRDELTPYDGSDVLDRALDWDVKARVRVDSLGAVARYRHPEGLRSLTLSGRGFVDVPELAGGERARDSLYDAVGRDAPSKPSGFELGAAAQFDAYWGASLGYKDRADDSPDHHREAETWSAGLGFNPLGDNDGKDWNWSLFAGVNHQDVVDATPERREEKDGWGWSAGAAFRQSLEAVPVPLLNPEGGRHDDGFWLDRWTASLGVADSEIGPLTVRAAVGASAYLTKHLKLSCELGVSCTEQGDVDFSPNVGANLKF